MSLVTAENLVKDYRTGDVAVHAIRGVDFTIEPASFVCFVGPSGSGKSTLLNMIGCLDPPTKGRLTVSGTDVSTLDHHAAAVFRGENIGFVFQDFNLIPVLTAYENVEYPLIMVQKWTPQRRRERIQSLLAAAGIADQADMAFDVELGSVEGDNAGRFLSAMLQGVQPECGERRGVGVAEHAEHPAFFVELVEVGRAGEPIGHQAGLTVTACLLFAALADSGRRRRYRARSPVTARSPARRPRRWARVPARSRRATARCLSPRCPPAAG